MSNAIAFPTKRDEASKRALHMLDLPAPRVWTPKHLAEFLGVSVHWVRKRTESKAENPIPRVAGVGRLRFDTHSPAFQQWLRRLLGSGYIDNVESDE